MDFGSLSLIPPLLKAVQKAGYTEPSPIQQQAIPPVLAGRDLLGCAQTGTGKTAAFALPILQRLHAEEKPGRRPIRTLILTPTRELALQIQESFEMYGKYLPLRSTVIFGGVGQGPQVSALQKGVDILVATPGRLNDLIGQGFVKLDQLEIFVLDEADRMLDMGFIHDVKKVLRQLPHKRQTLLFSATMPPEIAELAGQLLHDPVEVYVTPPATTVELIDQKLYKVDKGNKRHLLAQLLQQPDVTSALVFTRTKHGADRVARDLMRTGIQAAAIHGNKSQGARVAALAGLKSGKVKALVATDIAARGLDINELSHVFNFDLPNIPETYVHRIGRTGRAGHGGVAVSFCCTDELPYLADIQKTIGLIIPEVKNHAWPLQGEPAVPEAATATGGRPQRGQKAPAKEAPAKTGKAARTQAQAAPAQKQGGRATGKQTAPPKAAALQNSNGPRTKATASAARPTGQTQPQNRKKPGAAPRQNLVGGTPDPEAHTSGGQSIITRRPAWADPQPAPQPTAAPAPIKGDEPAMSRNRKRGGKNRNKNKKPGEENAARPTLPELPKSPNGVFDFTEEELAQDTGLQVINRGSGETKYASFEDFLKDHES